MNRARGTLSAVLAAIVLLSACGATSEGPATFLSIGESEVATLSWADDGGGNLVGSLQSATPNSSGSGDLVKNDNVSFTGTLHGGQISIVTNGILGSTSTWTGTLAGDTLTLNMPQDNGSIAPVTFTRGQVTAYNSAVSKFQAQVTQERAQAASDAASASANADADAASASAAAALAVADKQVSDDIAALQGSLSDGVPFDAFSGDMATLKRDLETTRSDALKATSAGAEARANMDACGDASTAQGDASTVGGDESTIGGDQSTAKATIDSVARQADNLRTSQVAMKEVYKQQGLTSSVPDAPVSNLLRKSDTAVKSWNAKVATYVATAHTLATQASAIADAAAKAVC